MQHSCIVSAGQMNPIDDAMYSKFVDCCTYLIELFTPARSQSRKVDKISSHIARLEKKTNATSAGHTSTSKKLMKAALRQRAISEQKLDFRDSRCFFRYSNSRLRSQDAVPTLIDGPKSLTSPRDKADHLANHFASVFNPPRPNQIIDPAESDLRRKPV